MERQMATRMVTITMADDGARCEQTFAAELAMLPDRLRRFVVESYRACCQEWYWYAPASLTGQYHPRPCRQLGGLVRHVRLACWWARRLGARWGDGYDCSEAVAALLLHDLRKYAPGVPFGQHGPAAGYALHRWWFERGGRSGRPVADEQIRRIIAAVHFHMGIWGEGPSGIANGELAAMLLVELVQLADVAAAAAADEQIAELANWLPPYLRSEMPAAAEAAKEQP